MGESTSILKSDLYANYMYNRLTVKIIIMHGYVIVIILEYIWPIIAIAKQFEQ